MTTLSQTSCSCSATHLHSPQGRWVNLPVAPRANNRIRFASTKESAQAMIPAQALAWLDEPAAKRESLAAGPITAGAVFIGPYTAQAAGDYATGSNHVLPTSGAARFRGGLSAADFVRVMSVQRVTRAGLRGLAPIILPLARAEGLEAHAESIEIRLGRSSHQPRATSHRSPATSHQS